MTKIVKKIVLNRHAQISLIAGIDQLAESVKVTLGPSGQCVVIDKQLGIPTLTKDGVTVAKSIYLEDPFESIGCELVKEAAKQTAQIAGDGTTTSIILVQSLMHEARILVNDQNLNAVFLARDFEKLAAAALSYIKKELSQELVTEDQCKSIATIAVNNDAELGDLIGEGVFKVGAHTPVLIEESHSLHSYSEMVEGFSFIGGLRSPFFYNIPGKEYWQETDVSILLMDMPLCAEIEVEHIINDHISKNKPLFVICSEVSPCIESLFVINATRQANWHYKLAAAHAPDYGENRTAVLEDIAVVTGATLVSLDNNQPNKSIRSPKLGKASFVRSSKKMTVLKNEDSARKIEIEKWIAELEARMGNEIDPKKKEFLKDRIQKLKVGTLTLKIGGATRYDVSERVFRVDDAVRAAQCAIEDGYVAGGGIALFKTSHMLPLLKKGIAPAVMEAFCHALRAPFKQLLENAGLSSHYDTIAEELRHTIDPNLGLDLSKQSDGEIIYRNLIQGNVVDPTKVVCTALDKAVSISCTIMTTASLVADLTDVEGYNRMVNSLPMLRG